jgi:hypothetical protein
LLTDYYQPAVDRGIMCFTPYRDGITTSAIISRILERYGRSHAGGGTPA